MMFPFMTIKEIILKFYLKPIIDTIMAKHYNNYLYVAVTEYSKIVIFLLFECPKS